MASVNNGTSLLKNILDPVIALVIARNFLKTAKLVTVENSDDYCGRIQTWEIKLDTDPAS